MRPQVSWNVCRKPTKMPTSLGVSLYCCCLTAWAVVHRNGGSPFVSILSPNGSFSPIVLSSCFPDSSYHFVFCTSFWRPLSFQKESLSLLWQACGWFHKDTVLLSYQNYGRRGPSIFLYKAFGRWACCPKKLENRILGLGYKDTDCLSYPRAGLLIALFQTLAVLVVLWGLQVLGVFGIWILLLHLHSVSSPQNFESKRLWYWPITEFR